MDGEEAVKIGAEAVWPNMPTLLCVWHVNMCVQENCKKRAGIYWPAFDQGWRNIQRSRTIEEFEDWWLQFQTQWAKEDYGQAMIDNINYLADTWLKPGQKERLVDAWTSMHRHYGTLVTSRFVEILFPQEKKRSSVK